MYRRYEVGEIIESLPKTPAKLFGADKKCGYRVTRVPPLAEIFQVAMVRSQDDQVLVSVLRLHQPGEDGVETLQEGDRGIHILTVTGVIAGPEIEPGEVVTGC